MSVYLGDDFEIDCRFGWDDPPQKPNDCKKCDEKSWCPLSFYRGEDDEDDD
jgi:hypothetical protein